ncbi:hypothetical protein SPAN111604_11245 [Sphingomonas antarctica]|uniref:PEPxxWA-CTERM sorting domain-containing protein n=1 Tax=Sphingomonas antarctica TaxID=2040274 RepID=UPI0039E9BF3A
MFKQVIAATALLVAGSAQAANVVTSFGTANSVFSFGSGTGAGFTKLPNFVADGCVGTTGLACYNTPGADYTFPVVGKNISASNPLTFYTNVLPTDQLFMQSLPGATATVRFTATQTATYKFNGGFTRIDSSNGAGDGVLVGYTSNAGGASSPLGTTEFNRFAVNTALALNAGDTVDFYVNALGNTNNDGTGFSLTANVPEPASWALMLGGFGLMGATLRRRRSTTVTA